MTAKQYLTKCIRYASNTNQTDAPYCHCGAYMLPRKEPTDAEKEAMTREAFDATGDMKMFGR